MHGISWLVSWPISFSGRALLHGVSFTYTCSNPIILQLQNTSNYLFRDYLVGGISMHLSLKYNYVYSWTYISVNLALIPFHGWTQSISWGKEKWGLGKINRKRKSDTVRKCLSFLKGWTFLQFCTNVLPLISMDNWEYIVFYRYICTICKYEQTLL